MHFEATVRHSTVDIDLQKFDWTKKSSPPPEFFQSLYEVQSPLNLSFRDLPHQLSNPKIFESPFILRDIIVLNVINSKI